MVVTSRLLYCWVGFEENPHGMICVYEIERIKSTLFSAGNGMEGAIIHELNHKNNKIHDNVRPYYPGCNEIREMEDLAISHQNWLNFVIKHESANESRDKKNCGFTRRIALGFTQKQDKAHDKMKHFQDEMMPFPSFLNLIDKSSLNPVYLPNILKEEAADIMSLSQEILDKTFLEKKLMNDKLRTRIFGMNFAKSFYKICIARFEFFEVFIEFNASLNRYVDYSNDGSEHYKFGCSYSYLIISNVDGKLYRVNFIMTTRLVCGQFIQKIS